MARRGRGGPRGRARDRTKTQGRRHDPGSRGVRVAWLSLCALFVAVPVATANLRLRGVAWGAFLSDQVALPKTLLALVLLGVSAAALVVSASRGEADPRRTHFDPWVIAIPAWSMVTAIFAVHRPTALFGAFQRYDGAIAHTAYAVAFILGVQMLPDGERLRGLARCLVGGAAVVAGYGLLQSLQLDPLSWEIPWERWRAFGTYGNPDLLGGYLTLVLPVALGVSLSARTRRARLAAFVATAVVFSALLLTFSRGAWAGALAGSAVVVLAALRSGAAPRRALAFAAVGAAGITGSIAALTSTSASTVTNLISRAASSFDFGQGSVATRLAIWEAAARATAARPLVGWGADNFGLVWQRFVPATHVRLAGWSSVADNAHDWPLQLASTVGLPGALLTLGVAVSVLWLTFRTAVGAGRRPDTLLYASFWASALAFLVYSLAGLVLPGTAVLFWVVLGGLARPLSAPVRAPDGAPARRGLLGAAAALTVLPLLLCAIMLPADAAAGRARRVAGREAETGLYESASRTNPWMIRYRLLLARAYLMRAASLAPGSPSRMVDLSSAEAAYLGVAGAAPGYATPLTELVSVYNEMQQEPGEAARASALARETYERAMALAPNDPALKVKAAVAEANAGDASAALGLLEAAIRLDPGYAEPWVVLYRVQCATHAPGATATLATMRSRFPNDPSVRRAIGDPPD